MREVLIVVVVMALIACCLQGCLFGKKSDDADKGDAKSGAKGDAKSGALPEDPTKIAGAPGAGKGGPPGMPGMPGAPGAAKGGPPGMPGMPGAPGAGAPPGMPGAGAPPGMPGAGAPPAMPGAPAAGGGDASAMAKDGMNLKHSGDYAGAGAKFAAAIMADPNNADAVWGGAWVAAEMGQKDMAAQGFQKFLTLSQDADKVSKAKAALKRLGK